MKAGSISERFPLRIPAGSLSLRESTIRAEGTAKVAEDDSVQPEELFDFNERRF